MALGQLRLTTDQEKRLIAWLDYWLLEIENRITQRVRRWIRYRQYYEGKPQAKTFPWPNASNAFIPMVPWTVDAIHANMMTRLYGYDRLWDINSFHAETVVGMDEKTAQPITWSDLADACQDFMAFYCGENGPTDHYPVVSQGLLECIKLGTVVWYDPWVVLSKNDTLFDPTTGVASKRVPRVVYEGPRPRLIPLEDFTIMPGYSEIHGPDASPLVGHYSWFRRGQLKLLASNGRMLGGEILDDILAHPGSPVTEGDSVKDDQSRQEGDGGTVNTDRRDDYRLWNGVIDFDLNDDGNEVSLAIAYHRDSSRLASVTPPMFQSRPYTAARYITRENRFYGIGIPEALEHLQLSLNTVYNQAIDNGTLANTRWFKVKRGSYAAETFDSIYPMKKVYVDNPDDITGEQLGEIYPSIFEIARNLQDFGERRSGISDPNLGHDVNPRTPATSTMAYLQESTKRFDLYAKDIRRALSELGLHTLEHIQQFKPTGTMYNVMGDRAELVSKTLTLPMSVSLREHLHVTTTSSASASNKEIVRQNAMAAYQMIVQYGQSLAQVAQGMQSPMVSPAFRKMLYDLSQLGERVMKRVLENLELADLAAMLPQLEDLYAEGQAQAANAGQGPLDGPGGVAPGAGPGGPAGNGGQPGGPGQSGGLPGA